jgi:two-component system sensor histidine kinase/response regulator
MNNHHKKANILIVDDFTETLKMLAEIMTHNGYYVRPVTSGKLAISAAQALPPDLILLDIIMPDMDGFETCRLLKSHEKTRHIPIIFLTAMTDTENIIKGFELGAEDYVTKPFNTPEVLSRIKTHLELSQSRKTIEQKNQKQNELIHVLCHDLMNSIGATRSILDIIKIDIQNNVNYMDCIEKSTNNAIEIIDLVRQISSLENGKLNLELKPYCLKELINESLAILDDKFIKKSIQAIVNIDETIYVNVENISFINSVVINLLTNAIKFSFSQSSIIIKAEQTEEETILSIEDFGIGMPECLCDDIFKINKPTTRTGTNGELGTGFGMPLVKDFVEAYSGTITVVSCEESPAHKKHGTTFFITLPKV